MVAEVIEHGANGLIVPSGDVGALTAAVRFLIKDRAAAQRMGLAGRRTIEQGFGRAVMVRRMLEVYAAALDGTR
jgi:glycosyltransferase involved in cell wall biosynthesis